MNRLALGLIICASAALLSACDGNDSAAVQSSIDNLTANWSTLADGSKFARAVDVERSRDIAMRCWPEASGSHLCLSVVKNDSAMGVTTVSRSTESSLPPMLWGLGGSGYRCEDLMGQREEIASGDDRLISNILQDTGRPWSRSFVEGYMAKNKVEGPGYFRCLDVLEAVTQGSPRTLGTTSITRAMAS